MKIRYRDKIYNSDDLPLFFYFKTSEKKDDFVTFLANNTLINEFKPIPYVHVVLAGNTLIKDKRAKVFLSFNEIEEKRALQKSIHLNPKDSNAFLCSPPDIEERNLELWLEKYVEKFE